MTHATERRAGRRASRDVPAQSRGGLAQGSVVLTLDGALPIEFLTPGDRIITRNGARSLRGVDVRTLDQAPIRIAPGTLGHDRPGEALLIAPGQRLRVTGWRARALFRRDAALVPVSRLADGQYIAPSPEAAGLRVFTLRFDTAEVFYADGLEVAGEVHAAVSA